jgi:hypothetical protein
MLKWIPSWKDKYASFEIFLDSAREEDNYLIEKGIYIDSLLRWEAAYGKQMTAMCSEVFFDKPQNACDHVFEWLGVRPFKLANFDKLRSTKSLPMKPETRKLLQEFYAPYNERLFEHLSWSPRWSDNNV